MELLNLKTKEIFEAKVLEAQSSDYKKIQQSGEFVFDWKQEKENQVFKIVRKSAAKDGQIHVLISLTDMTRN